MKTVDLILQTRLQPLRPPKLEPHAAPGRAKPVDADQAFGRILSEKIQQQNVATLKTSGGLEFSAHAQARLQDREIPLNADMLNRLDHGVRLADLKGSTNTLVMMDDTAFIVSVKNKKVITAITKDAAVDNVFTKIDSATIV